MIPAPPKLTLLLYRLSALFTLLTVCGGAVVCATRSGFDCHSWPGCYDTRFAPGPAEIPDALVANPALEMVHRTIAMSTGAILVATAIASLWLVGFPRLVRVLPWVAVGCAGASAIFGKLAVTGTDITVWGSAADILAALVAMTVTLIAAVALERGSSGLTPNGATQASAAAVVLLVVMHDAALFSAGYRSFTRCLSWPILWLAHDDNLALQVLRTGLGVAAIAAVAWAVRHALRTSGLRTHGLVLAALQALVLILAVAYRASNADGGLLGITFSLVSVAVLWTSVLLVARAGLLRPVPEDADLQPVASRVAAA